MSPIVQLVLIAGAVVAVFLFLAALVWGIRTRRGEENFVPAPKSLKNYSREETATSTGNETVPDWIGGMNPESPDTAKEESVPGWPLQPEEGPQGSGQPAQTTIGAEPRSLLGDLMRNAMPQLSTVMDLAKMVKQMQAAGDLTDGSDERKSALRKALDQMLEQQPGNEFLIQIRDSLESGEGAGAETDTVVQVVRVAGRNVIRIDGVEYNSLADISDPDLRNEARKMLLDLDDPGPS
jgi:hypothetical protein